MQALLERITFDFGPEEAKHSLKVITGFFFLGIFSAVLSLTGV